MNIKLRKLITASLMAAITCVLTYIVKVPMPLCGYVNLGDCAVLLSAWLLGPLYGALASGIGSAVADLISGYAAYAPATFVIKALVAVVAFYVFKAFSKMKPDFVFRIISGIVGEIIMVMGYFAYEATVMGYGLAATSGFVGNSIQAAVCIALATILIEVIRNNKALNKLLSGNMIYKN